MATAETFIPAAVFDVLKSAKPPSNMAVVRMLEIAYGALEEAERIRTDGLNNPGAQTIANKQRAIDVLANKLRSQDAGASTTYTEWDSARTMIIGAFAELDGQKEGRAALQKYFDMFIHDVAQNAKEVFEYTAFGLGTIVLVVGAIAILAFWPKGKTS